MQKTLGGDRLGSGKKMKVDLHGFERSTHDKGYVWRSTMSPGTLVPFMKEIALPGDTFDIDLGCDVKTHPTVGPLFGSYKVQLDVFQAPIRLYNSLLHNNALGIGMKISDVKFPIIPLWANPIGNNVEDYDNCQINPSSIASYLGIRGVGQGPVGGAQREFNAIPLLAYWEIYKQYYSNKMEEIGAVVHTGNPVLIETVDTIEANGTAVVAAPAETNAIINPNEVIEVNYTGAAPRPDQIYFNTDRGVKQLSAIASFYVASAGKLEYKLAPSVGPLVIFNWRYREDGDLGMSMPEVVTFPLENIDNMRNYILGHQSKTNPFNIFSIGEPPYGLLMNDGSDITPLLNSQEGLAIKTYQSDLFNNWLNTEWIDGTNGISEITKIDTTDGGFTLDTLNLAKKVYEMLNRIAVSGGTYDDWLDVQYGHERYTRAESPMYMGGLSKELVFQEVVSNAAAEGQELGTIAGKGVMSGKHKGGQIRIKIDEPSYIIGIVSLTPRVDYSQGNDWDVHLKTMDDLHKPMLDEIGFQDLITEQMAWFDTKWDTTSSSFIQKSAGKQPAWLNYMTSVNVVRGNFAIADNEMFMTLNRRYEFDFGAGILDLTTYVDPAKFNFIFADTAMDAQNFWVQIAVDNIVRRKMSARLMPNI